MNTFYVYYIFTGSLSRTFLQNFKTNLKIKHFKIDYVLHYIILKFLIYIYLIDKGHYV